MFQGAQSIARNISTFGDGFASLIILGSPERIAAVRAEAVNVVDGKQIRALDVDFSRSNADISEEIVERVAALSATPDDSLIVLADHAGARFHRLAAIVNPLRRRGYVVTRVFGRVIFGAGEVAPSRGVTFREAF